MSIHVRIQSALYDPALIWLFWGSEPGKAEGGCRERDHSGRKLQPVSRFISWPQNKVIQDYLQDQLSLHQKWILMCFSHSQHSLVTAQCWQSTPSTCTLHPGLWDAGQLRQVLVSGIPLILLWEDDNQTPIIQPTCLFRCGMTHDLCSSLACQ